MFQKSRQKSICLLCRISKRHYGEFTRPTDLWAKLAVEQDERRSQFISEGREIIISTPWKDNIKIPAYSVSPMDLLKQVNDIDENQKKKYLFATVDNNLWNMKSPLVNNGKVDFHMWSDSDIRSSKILWQSAATVLSAALYAKYTNLDGNEEDQILHTSCESLEDGGFSSTFLLRRIPRKDNESSIEPNLNFISELIQKNSEKEAIGLSFDELKRYIQAIIDADISFDRLELPKEIALMLFRNNIFKRYEILQKKEPTVILNRCGNFIDINSGIHVASTSQIGFFDIIDSSAVNYRNLLNLEPKHPQVLTRLRGIAFPEKDMMEKWKILREKAIKMDHRLIGKEQKLFMSNELAPGSAFFLPHGTRIFLRLQEVLRSLYRRFGYEEIMTPLIYKKKLWETSGHWENYKDDMFLVGTETSLLDMDNVNKLEKENKPIPNNLKGTSIIGLKPMNCPGHCLVYSYQPVSYRDLPIRLADFSPLHRNEPHGSLSGLTRLTRFHQDDAHIFCTLEQVQKEIQSTLKFFQELYMNILKFSKFKLSLSTRPISSIGTNKEWEEAEKSLELALNLNGYEWSLSKGDGAFYGPKIDVHIQDSNLKWHQTGTIQLDFQMPERFNLLYQEKDGKYYRPVMIHRAILGSFERFIAIYLEKTGGKLPFWLNPRQCVVIPKTNDIELLKYAQNVRNYLADGIENGNGNENENENESSKIFNSGYNKYFHVEMDNGKQLSFKKVQNALKLMTHFIVIVKNSDIGNDIIRVKVGDHDIGEMHMKRLRNMFIQMDQNFE